MMYEKNLSGGRQKDVVTLDRVALSRVLALLVALLGGAFIAGYFLGKRQAVAQELDRMHKIAFADQVAYAMGPAPSVPTPQEPYEHIAEPVMPTSEPIAPVVQQRTNPEPETPQPTYYAPVYGGTRKQVESFAARMRQRSVPIRVQKRTGTTAAGKEMTWYQAATESYTNQEELKNIVNIIKKTEHIQDIAIIMSVPAQKGTHS